MTAYRQVGATFADFPASAGWALSYELLSAMHRYEIAASTDGDAFRVTISAQPTQAYAPGSYDWRARVTNAEEVYTVATGRLTPVPNAGESPPIARECQYAERDLTRRTKTFSIALDRS